MKKPNRIILIIVSIFIICGFSLAVNQIITDFRLEKTTSNIKKEKILNYNVGETFAVDKMNITVNSINYQKSLPYADAEKGKEFLLINVKIINKDTISKSYYTSNFKLENSNGELLEPVSLKGGNENFLGSGELAIGGYKEGNLLFEIEKNATKLILYIENGLFTDTYKVTIK